jgi:hypothetical protein
MSQQKWKLEEERELEEERKRVVSDLDTFISLVLNKNILVIGDPDHGERFFDWLGPLLPYLDDAVGSRLVNALYFTEGPVQNKIFKRPPFNCNNFIVLDESINATIIRRIDDSNYIEKQSIKRMCSAIKKWTKIIGQYITTSDVLSNNNLIIVSVGTGHLYPYENSNNIICREAVSIQSALRGIRSKVGSITITSDDLSEIYDDYSTNILRGATEVPVHTKRIRSIYYNSMSSIWGS